MRDKSIWRAMWILFALAFGVCAVVTYAESNKPEPLPDITAKSLTVKSDVGGSISLQPTKQGPGLWLTSPNGDTVAITAFNDHCGVMLLPKDGVGGASPLALVISGKSAYIQVRDKNERVIVIPVEKLGRAAAWLQTQPKE